MRMKPSKLLISVMVVCIVAFQIIYHINKRELANFQLAPDLYMLLGTQVVQQNRLDERGFDENFGFDSESLVTKRRCLKEEVEAVEAGPLRDAAHKSLDPDLIQRGKVRTLTVLIIQPMN